MSNLGILFALIILTFLVWFWADSMRVRERALLVCANACKEVNAQLLDQTVALRRIRIARDQNGRSAWLRTYRFEYSLDGAQRLRGSVIMRGHLVETVAIQSSDGGTHFEQG
jgi:Protein of unknown function (DUF3301)